VPASSRNPGPDPGVAIVTGAGSDTGIGFAIARRLASSGFTAVITGLSPRIHDRAGELVGEGLRVVAFQGDLTDETVIHELVEVVDGLGHPLAALVNNAGMAARG